MVDDKCDLKDGLPERGAKMAEGIEDLTRSPRPDDRREVRRRRMPRLPERSAAIGHGKAPK